MRSSGEPSKKGKGLHRGLRPRHPDMIVCNPQNQSYRPLMSKGLVSSGFSKFLKWNDLIARSGAFRACEIVK